MTLDLETLKHVKFMFDIHSDHSSHCNGYRSLVDLIDVVDKEEKALIIDGVSNCQFEKYAEFCIECDRKGMKPLKYQDYLKIG